MDCIPVLFMLITVAGRESSRWSLTGSAGYALAMSSPAKNAAKPWYSEGLRFACTGCGACCKGEGYVWVDESEIARLAEYLDMDSADFERRYLRRVGRRLALTDAADLACVFWDEGCTVYEARPRQCRTFPFWRDNVASEAAWELTAQESPGVNAGRLYSLGEIDRLLDGAGAASQQASHEALELEGESK